LLGKQKKKYQELSFCTKCRRRLGRHSFLRKPMTRTSDPDDRPKTKGRREWTSIRKKNKKGRAGTLRKNLNSTVLGEMLGWKRFC